MSQAAVKLCPHRVPKDAFCARCAEAARPGATMDGKQQEGDGSRNAGAAVAHLSIIDSSEEALVEDALVAKEQAEEVEAEAGSPYRWRMADSYAGLAARGWTQQRIAKSCEVSQATVSIYLTVARRYQVPNNRPTFWQAYKDVPGAAGAHVSNNAGDNEWYTPAEYIAAAVVAMGGVDLDPASSESANEIVGAAQFFTELDDGLTREWAGRVWMNPPYARPLIDGFCGKLAESYSDGAVTQACVLVNNATETGWFHALAEVASAMCFPRHRVKFWHPEKEKESAPLQGQAVIYLGDAVQDFRSAFVEFGFTVCLD